MLWCEVFVKLTSEESDFTGLLGGLHAHPSVLHVIRDCWSWNFPCYFSILHLNEMGKFQPCDLSTGGTGRILKLLLYVQEFLFCILPYIFA